MSPILQSLQPFISAIGNPLILILASPIIGAIILLLFIRDDQRQEARTVAIVATAICLLLSIYVFMDMNQVSNLTKAGDKAASGLSYFIDETNLPWVPALGISFHVGVDGSFKIVSKVALGARLTYHNIRATATKGLLTANAMLSYRF